LTYSNVPGDVLYELLLFPCERNNLARRCRCVLGQMWTTTRQRKVNFSGNSDELSDESFADSPQPLKTNIYADLRHTIESNCLILVSQIAPCVASPSAVARICQSNTSHCRTAGITLAALEPVPGSGPPNSHQTATLRISRMTCCANPSTRFSLNHPTIGK
jgi:hypothetical protein